MVVDRNVVGGVEGEAAGEDRQPAEDRLFLGGQQIVAPGDRVAHRALTGRGVAGAAVSSGSRCSNRANSAAGGSTLTRAAASSMASGRPSSRRQISATGATWSS